MSVRRVARKAGRAGTVGALLLIAALGGCESKAYDLTEDLSYDSTIGYDGTFDVYEPKGDSVRSDRPAILAIHGGAWRGGDKAWGSQIAREFCPSGYVVLSINYRASARPNGKWPAQIEDVQKGAAVHSRQRESIQDRPRSHRLAWHVRRRSPGYDVSTS